MNCGIYAIKSGEQILYIGQSCNIAKRWKYHQWQLKKRIHPNSYLQRVYDKDKQLDFEVVESEIARENLTTKEIHYITEMKPLCNFAIPGANDTWIFTEERNRKVSIGNIGKPKSTEHRKNISLAKMGANNPMYGQKPWNKGNSDWCAGEKNTFFGKHHSIETKLLMSMSKGVPFDIKKAQKLRNQGLSYRAISDIVGADRKRISKVLKWQNQLS